MSPLVEGESISWLLDKVYQPAFRAPEDALHPAGVWLGAERQPLHDRNLLVHSAWLMEAPELPGAALGRRARRGKSGPFTSRRLWKWRRSGTRSSTCIRTV